MFYGSFAVVFFLRENFPEEGKINIPDAGKVSAGDYFE